MKKNDLALGQREGSGVRLFYLQQILVWFDQMKLNADGFRICSHGDGEQFCLVKYGGAVNLLVARAQQQSLSGIELLITAGARYQNGIGAHLFHLLDFSPGQVKGNFRIHLPQSGTATLGFIKIVDRFCAQDAFHKLPKPLGVLGIFRRVHLFGTQAVAAVMDRYFKIR